MAGDYDFCVSDARNDEELYFTDNDGSLKKIAKRNHMTAVDVMFFAIKLFVDLDENVQDASLKGWVECSQE